MIKKHGSLYWLDIRVDGNRIRRSLKTGEQGLAIERAREIERELRAPKTPGVDIKDFSLQYRNWAWDTKPASADQESRRMKKILEFFDRHGIRTLSDVTPYHLEQLRAWLKTRKVKVGDKEVDRPRNQATLNRYMQLLRGMFYKAIDWEIYKGPNPVKKIKFFHEDRAIKPLSHEEVKTVLGACWQIAARKGASSLQKAFADLVEFAINTGMRKSEILNLQWKDIKSWEATIKGKGNPDCPPERARAIVERQQKRTPTSFTSRTGSNRIYFDGQLSRSTRRPGSRFTFTSAGTISRRRSWSEGSTS